MEKDFHYFLTYALLKLAGFGHPDLIAYSSQFVDDNNEGQFAVEGEEISFPEKLRANGGYYYPIMTQSLSPKSLDPYVQKYVYVPFHFLPGDNSVQINGKKNPLSATPDSPNAREVLSRALQSDNPYQIGIAIHTFADTWSHQNFSGMREDWNAVFPWYNLFKSLVPNIGHAEVGHLPDIISESWTDYRLGARKIDNRKRALEAAEAIYVRLQKQSKTGPPWVKVEADVSKMVNIKDYDGRIAAISAYLMRNGHGPIPPYSKDEWIEAALDKSGDEVVLASNFTQTDWYAFHQAAKVHFAIVMDRIKELL
jgi:hypothetical protein